MPLTQDEIDELARNPQQMTGDEGSITERSADDLIKLNEYAKSQEAAAAGLPRIRIFKVVPPGSA